MKKLFLIQIYLVDVEAWVTLHWPRVSALCLWRAVSTAQVYYSLPGATAQNKKSLIFMKEYFKNLQGEEVWFKPVVNKSKKEWWLSRQRWKCFACMKIHLISWEDWDSQRPLEVNTKEEKT